MVGELPWQHVNLNSMRVPTAEPPTSTAAHIALMNMSGGWGGEAGSQSAKLHRILSPAAK